MTGCYPTNNCQCKCHVSQNECCAWCNLLIKNNSVAPSFSPMVGQIQNLEGRIKNIEDHFCFLNNKADSALVAHHYIEITKRLDKLENADKRLDSHINKLHEMINMEDRITASDVLNRLTMLEESIKQIIEDISKVVKKPHACPICDGRGGFFANGTMDEECYVCDGKAIVWG